MVETGRVGNRASVKRERMCVFQGGREGRGGDPGLRQEAQAGMRAPLYARAYGPADSDASPCRAGPGQVHATRVRDQVPV